MQKLSAVIAESFITLFFSENDFYKIQIFTSTSLHGFPVADCILIILHQPVVPDFLVAAHFLYRNNFSTGALLNY